MAGLSCWKLATVQQHACTCIHNAQRSLTCRASNNKDRGNYIEIGSTRRDIPDGVEIIRVNRPAQPERNSSKGKPSRTPVVLHQVDAPTEQQNPIVEATKRGRGGKTVTIVKGLKLRLESMEALCKQLKNKLGTGGSVKDGQVEIQGDHTQTLVDELVQLGYKAKKSGR